MFNLKISFRNIAVILTLVFYSQFVAASTLKFDSSIIKSIKKFNPGIDNKSRLEIFQGDKEALKLVYNLGSGKRNSAIYDLTPVLKQTGNFSKNSQLNFEITGSKNANIVVHLLDSSGRWYLFRRKVLVDRKQFICLRANLQEYSQSWGKGCHGVFVYPLQKLRFGVEGSGQGYVVISKFGIEPFIALNSFNGSKSPCPPLPVLDRIEPVKFQLTDPKVINVMDYGAVPNDGKPDESAVIKAIKAAGKYKSTIVRFPKGTYHFSSDLQDKTAIKIENASNLIIDGNGATFVIPAFTQGVELDGCRNIKLSNFKLDNSVLPAVSAVVIDKSGSKLKVKLEDKYFIAKGSKVNMIFRYDPETRLPDTRNALLMVPQKGQVDGRRAILEDWPIVSLKNNYAEIDFGKKASAHLRRFRKNDLLNFRIGSYKYNGITVYSSKNVILENIDIYSCYGMGTWMNDSENIYVNSFRLMRKPGSKRLMSSSADGFHLKDCRGTVVVENSVVMHSFDDCINIKSRYHKILKQLSHRSLLIQLTRHNSQIPHNGEMFEFFTASAKSVLSARTVKVGATADPMQYIVEFDRDIPASGARFISSLFYTPEKVRISNCRIGENRGRGMLIQARNVLVKDCEISRVAGRGLWCVTDLSKFWEALPPSNVKILHNKIIDTPYMWPGAAIEIGYFFPTRKTSKGDFVFRNIIIKNNRFLNYNKRMTDYYISATSVSSLFVENNTMIDQSASLHLPVKGVRIDNCKNVMVKSNHFTPESMIIISDKSESNTIYIDKNTNIQTYLEQIK